MQSYVHIQLQTKACVLLLQILLVFRNIRAPAVFMYGCVEYPTALQFALVRLPPCLGNKNKPKAQMQLLEGLFMRGSCPLPENNAILSCPKTKCSP